MRYRFVIPLLMVGVAVGCASAGGSASNHPTRRSSDVITAEEIQQTSGLSTAYDAVQRLRPQFLSIRGPGSIRQAEGVMVYVDGVRRGDVNELRQIPIAEVKEIRYINARDATTKYGTGVNLGVIEVTTN